MHDPYIEPVTSSYAGSRNSVFTDERDKEYLNRLNHFDRALGRFLLSLKQSGKLEKTLIVIAGDHEIASEDVSPLLHDTTVPLIIINSPIKSISTSKANQTDIFPTILDLMGKSYKFLERDYNGIGRSIFDNSNYSGISEEDYEVSEMLIRAEL